MIIAFVYKFCKIELTKTALTGCHTKMKVHNDQCQTCTPVFINSTLTRPNTQPINSQYNSEGMYVEGSLNFLNSAAKIDCEYNYNYLDKQLYKTKFNIAPWEFWMKVLKLLY